MPTSEGASPLVPCTQQARGNGKGSCPIPNMQWCVDAESGHYTTHEEAVVIVKQVVKLAGSGTSIKVICHDNYVFVLPVHFYAQEHTTCQLVISSTSIDREVVNIKATTEKQVAIAN